MKVVKNEYKVIKDKGVVGQNILWKMKALANQNQINLIKV